MGTHEMNTYPVWVLMRVPNGQFTSSQITPNISSLNTLNVCINW